MTKKGDENFENSTKCWICGIGYIDSDARVRDHCHISGKYRGSAHGDCNIKVKINHKSLIAFHCLKNYDSHLLMPELGKFEFKMPYQMD